jgi:hypothetical protein
MAVAILAADTDTLEAEGILEEEAISRAEDISEAGVISPDTMEADFTDTSGDTDTVDTGIIAVRGFSFPTRLSLVMMVATF